MCFYPVSTPPLVVLNNFGAQNSENVKLMRVMFQNMLPSINVQTIKLSNCRRVVLFHYKKDEDSVEMRHYAIKASPVGVHKSIKKLLQGKLPNLSKLQDMSEYVEDPYSAGFGSDSEAEDEDNSVSHSPYYDH